MNIPLALVAGAAIASNPRWFPTEYAPNSGANEPATSGELSPVEAIRSQAPSRDKIVPRGRRGPESPELRALRLAEDQLFANLDVEGLEFQGPGDIQAFTSSSDFLDGLNQPNLPIAHHDSVRRYLDFFSTSKKGRKVFSTWLKRSGRYRTIIAAALREKGLPSDLEAMVFIESGFWPTAKSGAGAAGLWQFMPATARAYGLTVTSAYDERRNPWRSSQAAAEHLADLHARFNSWDLALAAYNYGYHNVERRMAKAEVQDFWEIVDQEGTLPEETRRYVPKIHAVAVLLNNLDHFGFDTSNLDKEIRAAAFEVPPGTTLSALARAAGTSRANLKRMNAEFLSDFAPDRGAPVIVHIPRSNLARARVMLPRLLGGEMRELDSGRSEFFDFGSQDAPQSRLLDTVVSRSLQRRQVAELSSKNTSAAVSSRVKTSPPSTLSSRAPIESSYSSVESPTCSSEAPGMPHVGSEKTNSLSHESALALAFIRYRVSWGDSLSALALRFGVSERELVFDNAIRRKSIIFRGQELKIRDTTKSQARTLLEYKVRPGDSLGKIAKLHSESERKLVQVNGISNPDHIEVGQIVRIPPA